MKILKALLLVTLVFVFPFVRVYAQKMTAEEVIEKHLDTIGSPADRGQVRNILIKGDVKLAVHRHSSPYKTDGKVILASDGAKVLFRMAVNAPAVWKTGGTLRDNIVFDGSDVQVGFPDTAGIVGPGLIPIKSDFESFIDQCNSIVKNGILGGELLTGWNLADRSAEKGKLSFDGMDTADGEKYYVLKFDPRDGAAVKIRMFFDVNTFQHRRTEYYLTLHGSPPSLGASTGLGVNPPSPANYMKFIEVFSDFRKEGQLTLPHRYRLDVKAPVLFDSESEYELDLNEYFFNVPFDPASFVVRKK
jgi:hypothetical protein